MIVFLEPKLNIAWETNNNHHFSNYTSSKKKLLNNPRHLIWIGMIIGCALSSAILYFAQANQASAIPIYPIMQTLQLPSVSTSYACIHERIDWLLLLFFFYYLGAIVYIYKPSKQVLTDYEQRAIFINEWERVKQNLNKTQ